MHSLYDLKSCAQMKYSKRIIGSAVIMLLATIFIFSLGRQASHTQAATVDGPLHLALIPYYSIKGDWDSILNLNNSVSSPLAVSLTLYSLDGEASQLPDISLLANDTATVRLSELIAQSGDKKGRFQEGSVELRFNHDNGMALAPQLTVLDSKHGLSFDVEPPMGFKSSTLETLWWSPDDKTSGQIMLSNTTAERLDARLNIEWQSVVIPTPAISLSARQTMVLDIEKLLKGLGVKTKGIERGGLSISHSGVPGALIAQGVVLNKERHFASNLSIVDVLTQKTSTLNATGLLLGRPTAGSVFAEQSFFTPQLALKNTTKSKQAVTVTVQYTANGRLSKKALPVVNLSPHEVRMVDFSGFVESLRNVSVDSAGLRLDHTGAPALLSAR